MFPNLNAEMARQGLNAKKLAAKTNMKYDTLLNKLAGRFEFTRPEMLAIKKALAVEMILEQLFMAQQDSA